MRDFLAGASLLACIFVFGASLVAMVKPIPAIWMPTRRRAFAGMGVGFALFILTAILMPPQKKDDAGDPASVAPAKVASPEPEDVEERSLPFTPDQFKDRFNDLAKVVDKPWRIREFVIEDSGFRYMLSDHLAFVGSQGSDKRMKSLILLASGDGTLNSGLDVVTAMIITYCAATENSDLKQCGQPVMKLFEDFDQSEETVDTVVNNIKISFSRNDTIGSMLTVEPF